MKKYVLPFLHGASLILMSLFLLAACQSTAKEPAAVQPPAAGLVRAIDPVDLKLFNAAEPGANETSTAVHAADIKFFYNEGLYDVSAAAIDPADRKFLYAGGPHISNALAIVDPADRKFFYTTYGSGAQ